MKKLLTSILCCYAVISSAQLETFSKRTITSGVLSRPWEVVYGPNDSLWVTEATGYKITRWSTTATISNVTLLDLTTSKANWASGTGPQGGLMGLAIHPNLYSSDPAVRQAKPWVYVAYVYAKATPNTTCPDPGSGCFFSTRISRFEYKNNALINEVIILNNMPGSSDHNSGRLVISPDIETGVGGGLNTQYRLYYSIGDMGSGQFANTTRANNAQNQNILEGKILRINTESDGDAGQDQWVPDDNFNYDAAAITPQDYVYSMGHRNPQGLVWGTISGNRRLYSSEQSDRADDEINVIVKGSNYGWDKVSGKCDGDVNGFQIGGRVIGAGEEQGTNCAGTTQPIYTMFTNNATYPTTYPGNGTGSGTWPTIALSSIAVYNNNKIPGWYGSLLVTPLKQAQVYRLKLSADGSTVTNSYTLFTDIGGNRLRKITVAPDGLKFYVVRDGNNSITEYTYTGAISTLPVKLISFKGALVNNNTELKWETSQEMDASIFNVERSLDGTSYTTVGNVIANGNSNNQSGYSFTDFEAIEQPATILYYRLKMVDKDGQFTYSNVISVSLASAGGRAVIVPNPVENNARINVTVLTDGKAQWKLMDNSGRVLMQGSESLKSGNNQIMLNTSSIAAGIYYLRITGTGIDRQVKMQKL